MAGIVPDEVDETLARRSRRAPRYSSRPARLARRTGASAMTDIAPSLETPRADGAKDDGLTRRDFVRTTVIGTGFAAAVMPVTAQTVVHTDAEGLEAGEVRIASGGFDMPAYRAQPKGRSNLPVVLVVSEIFGVHEHIADVARRFAKQGYLAIAPSLFARQGDAGAYTDIGKLMSEVVSQASDEQVLGDLDAALAWAAAHGGDTARTGITGFCWGGRITWLYAARQPKLKAGVAWYGRLQGATDPKHPRHPIELAGELKAPVLGLYGGKDEGIPVASVHAMEEALQGGSAAAKASSLVVYPEAGHAFNADYRPSYRADAARDGWTRCLDWFRAHGVA
jgi:carboxymethylenebutenolidase